MLSMVNQGSQPLAAVDPNFMEKRSGDGVSQGDAPVIAGHYSWSASAAQVPVPWNYGANSGHLENTTMFSSVHNYDPLRDSTASESAQVATNSMPQASASSNLAATNGSQAFAGYVPYSSSTYAYEYGNIQYQSNYYGQPPQPSYSSYQQAGASQNSSQNSGASYQPHSSFQNTGSYATPTSYSGAYFASDHQTAGGYPTSGYFDQTNYWNDGSGGSYPLQYSNYPSSETNSAPSTSNAATSSYPYQQESNQWSTNYGASVAHVNYNPGPGGMVASTVPTATYPFQIANGGSLYASSQPPPPGTTSWRGDLGSSSLPSPQARKDTISRFPHGSWEDKALIEQNHHLNQTPSDLPKASDSTFPLYENHDGSEKTTCSYDPNSSLQVFSTGQVSQNPQQPLQTTSTMDACRVSKMQIPTNPRIASSLAVGMPKLDKETSTVNAAVKPAYISVQVPKLNNHLSSSDDTDAVIKGAFPPSVRAYVERCFSRCKDDAQRAANKLILSEKRSGDGVSQGDAPVIAGHYSWSASAAQVPVPWNYGANSGHLENTTMFSSVHNYDPLRDSTASESAQVATNSMPQASASSNLAATNGSQAFAGYVPYSSSTYAYEYGNIQYQSNYYGQPPQPSYSSYQQAGASQNSSQNSGASYQPHSSFQNTGSYATPTSYSGAYFASDHQTAGGYPTSGYFDQTNYWNDGSGGSYPLQYSNYPSSETNSAPSTSNAATSSYPYQQESNQWSTNYGASVAHVNYNPGPGGMVASTVPTATYPFQIANGGSLYASSQPPPPGTTSWRGDLGSSSLPSPQARKDTISRFPHGSWEDKALIEQNHHLNQTPSDLPKASDSTFPLYENHDGSEKTTCSYDPNSSLQVFSTGQVSQNPQQPLQTTSTMDACRVSKMQIPTNPRIASSLAVGMPKLDKETSTVNAAVKPAYISVQVPKLNNHLSSSDDTDAVIKGAFPPSVRAYVERCFSRCKDDAQRAANKLILSEIIAKAKDDGTLWTKNWDMEPLFPLPNSNSNGADQNILQSTAPSMPKFPSRRSKSRWEPVAEERLDLKVASVSNDSTKSVGWAERMAGSRMVNNMDNGRNSVKFSQQSLLIKTPQRPLKKSRFSDTSDITENGNSSSDSDKEQELTKHYSSAITLENSPEERKRREHRSKRFEKGQERQADIKQFRPKGSVVGNACLRRANALMLSKVSDDQCRAVEDIYWDALTVKGTCQDVEKRYLRLTSAPDPATVRPEEVLEKALHVVQTSQKNYLYKCDQLKSIRQDLTVQRIQNELTVKVYETHGRLALEAGDLPEFNQCQSQLKRLYAEGIKGCQMEFSAYNLLCAILHSNNKRDLLSSMNSLSNEAKQDETVKHALAVHSAVSSGNYVLFFRLYKAASSLITSLMDLHVEKMRLEAMKCISKSYRPTVPVTYIAHVLGFLTSVQTGVGDENGASGLEECEEWLKAHGAVLIVENNGELQLDTKASSSTLYMPEPEDAVAHGDANLAVDDFLTRTS